MQTNNKPMERNCSFELWLTLSCFVSFLFPVFISRPLDNITEWRVYGLEKGLIIDLYMFWSDHRACVGPQK